MTVNQLAKILAKAIAKGHGRSRVCIDKATYWSPLESDGGTIMDVKKAARDWSYLLDGDGAIATTTKGAERGNYVFLLTGDALVSSPVEGGK